MTTTAFAHLSTLADPTRARLLLALDDHELSVGELVGALQLPQSTVSRHLKHLVDDGWVTTRADGTSRFYRKVAEVSASAEQLWDVVRSDIQASPESLADRARVESAVADRRRRSREYFAAESAGWEEVRQELYGRGADLSLLAAMVDPQLVVGDLGCGNGVLTELLAAQVRRVIAVDASAEMLTAARTRVGPRSNVEWHLSDLERLPMPDAVLDVGILSLVLHFLPEPGLVIREAARTLKPGGRLVVMDMVPHDREDLRRSLGHAWSGFEGALVQEWFSRAGLTEVRLQRLAPDVQAKGPALFVAQGRRANAVNTPAEGPRVNQDINIRETS